MIATSKLLRHIGRTPELFDAWRQTPEWLNVTKRYLEIGSPTYPFKIPLSGGGGIQVNSPGELKVFWQIFVHRCYILPTHCETILDAGANVGLFALWAARERTKANIFSLEPFPSTFQHLEKNIKENGLQPRIRPIQCGLAGITEERLMRGGAESPNNSVVLRGMEGSATCTIPVACVTLADLMKNEALEKVDLLKMDIEGSEWEVILSTSEATLRKIRNIILEYHEVNARYGYTLAQLVTHLSSAGHRLIYQEENTERTGLAFFQSA